MTARSNVLMTALVAVMASSLGGCIPEYDAEGLHVLNQTGQTFWIDDEPENPENLRLRAPAGQSVLLPSESCQPGPEAQTEDGTVVAKLDEEWCPGQTWRVRAGGDSELLDAE